jgi:Cu/Ag efflux protein CusF
MRSPRNLRYVLCAGVLCAGLVTAASGEEKKKAAAPPKPTMTSASTTGGGVRTEEHLIEATATVMGIDLPKREVTLKGPEGNIETLELGPDVRRITEIKVGDTVNVQYYIGMAAELRAPTEEEKKEPFKIIDDTARAPKTEAPAGIKARTIRVVATVESMDQAAHTVTLKGPKGRYHTVQVEDPAVMAKVKKGDTVVVTAAEALAVSLEKAEKAAPKVEKK